MTGCRIGRVKFKGGAELHRLPVPSRDEAQRDMINSAVKNAGFYKPGELAGYVVFGWSRDGSSSIGYYLDYDGVVSVRMMPSFVADALREKMIETGDWG